LWLEGNRLPTTEALARSAGVSKSSMSHAIKLLVSHGTLLARPRRGIVLRARTATPDPPAPPRNKVETVTSELVRNILAGSYGAVDELPSLKELQAHFGVCFRTMRRAVDSLVAEGVLSSSRRGYRVRNPAATLPFKSLVLVVDREYDAKLPFFSFARSYFFPLLYALERECSRRNIRLEVERFPDKPANFPRRRDAIAYFVALAADPTQETVALLSRLLRFDTPVLVARESDHPAFGALPVSPHLVFLEDSNELAGFQIGQHLLARGFRRAVYITHFTDASWSVQRHRGLERAFRLAGEQGAVRQIVLSGSNHEYDDVVTELLRKEKAAAWVACDDALVVEILLPRLRARGIENPRTGHGPSLIGFNDQFEAFENRLSSYNFNPDGMAAAVLFHAQFPERRRKRSLRRHEPVVIGGYVIDRGSVRAPRLRN
jgi:DNA-binding LacI/PurR family transcriptional regulator/DNA-binding transcriptional regulator YhcF (GntR family)